MNTFKSWRSYDHFERYVKKNKRYFFDSDVDDFLKTVLETGKNRIEKIKAGSILWRSQLGHDWEPYYEGDEHIDDVPSPFKTNRMKPLKESATEGRANPKGIPFLYLATDKNTSMTEVRPWIGSYISVAQFKILKDLKIINCTTDKKGSLLYLEEPNTEKRETAVWQNIDKAFSKPITLNENSADYVPTQIIAELFKKDGFDGIAYGSSLGDGHNIALFDINVADLVNCTLFEAKELSFNFTQCSIMYFISKYIKNNS